MRTGRGPVGFSTGPDDFSAGQKRDDHGRWTSGGREAVRQSIEDCDNNREVENLLIDEMERLTGRVIYADFGDIDTARARQYAEGLLRAAERFPESRLDKVTVYDNDMMVNEKVGGDNAEAVTTYGMIGRNDEISFNSAITATYLENVNAMGKETGYSPYSTSVGTAIHEYGHVISRHDGAIEDTAKLVNGIAASGVSHGDPSEVVAGGIGRCASQNAQECCAEAFADVMINGKGASKLSQDVFKIIKAKYDNRVATLALARLVVTIYDFNPGQKRDDHGRWTGGGGGPSGEQIRDSLQNCADTAAVEVALADGLRAALGRDVPVSLQSLRVDLARSYAEGLLRGAEKFPSEFMGKVITYDDANGLNPKGPKWQDPCYGVTTMHLKPHQDEIAFNAGMDPDRLHSAFAANVDRSEVVPQGGVAAALHEYAHVVTKHDDTAWRAEDALRPDARSGGQTLGKYIDSHVSTYAATDAFELCAESFADVMVNGDQAKPASVKVYDVIRAKYDASHGGGNP